jgi:hypothetical protein
MSSKAKSISGDSPFKKTCLLLISAPPHDILLLSTTNSYGIITNSALSKLLFSFKYSIKKFGQDQGQIVYEDSFIYYTYTIIQYTV